jgi:hypothetical protein
MFRTPEQTTFENTAEPLPLDIDWMMDPNGEMLFHIEQTLVANTTTATDPDVPMIATTDQTTFAIPPDLGPFDLAWMVDLIESPEQPDVIGSSIDQSSLQLVPYHAPTLSARPESTAIVSSKRAPGTNEDKGPKPKRYCVSENNV